MEKKSDLNAAQLNEGRFDIREWYSADLVILELAARLGDLDGAIKEMRKLLASSDAQARASHIREITKFEPRKQSALYQSNDSFVCIDAAIFNFNDWSEVGDDKLLWSWPFSSLDVLGETGNRLRYEGVELMLGVHHPLLAPDPHLIPERGGRPRDDHRWDVFWLGAIEIALEGKLSMQHQNNVRKLRYNLLKKMGSKPFTDRVVAPSVQAIWNRFVTDDGKPSSTPGG